MGLIQLDRQDFRGVTARHEGVLVELGLKRFVAIDLGDLDYLVLELGLVLDVIWLELLLSHIRRTILGLVVLNRKILLLLRSTSVLFIKHHHQLLILGALLLVDGIVPIDLDYVAYLVL